MLSAALTRALTTPAFADADFVPTQWDTAEQKAKFANALLTFVAHFFLTAAGKLEFLEQCVTWPCHGDPTFTYSDV